MILELPSAKKIKISKMQKKKKKKKKLDGINYT